MSLSKKEVESLLSTVKSMMTEVQDQALKNIKKSIKNNDLAALQASLQKANEAEGTLAQARATLEYVLQLKHNVMPKGKIRRTS